jgi:energy-converting hydrogenase Eha subunit C
MAFFRLAAVVLFVIAGLGAVGWLVHTGPLNVIGLIAFGLACFAASFGQLDPRGP